MRRLWSDTAILITGQIIGQLVLVFSAPFIARRYSPADFGEYGIVLALIGTIGVVSGLRYDQAIPIATDEAESNALSLLAVLCSLTAAVFALAFLLLPAGLIAHRTNYVLHASAGIVLVGLDLVFTARRIRCQHWHTLALGTVLYSSIQPAVQLSSFGYETIGLLRGYVAAMSVKVLCGAIPDFKRSSGDHGLNFDRLRNTARTYRDFPAFDVPQRLLGAVQVHVPLFIVTTFAGASAAGAYSMAFRLVQRPASTFSTSFRQVFFRYVATVERTTLGRVYRQVFCVLAMICVPAAILGFAVAPTVFSYFLGADWALTGDYARWLVIWLLAVVIATPAEVLAKTLRRQNVSLMIRSLEFAVGTLAMVLAIHYISDVRGVALFCTVGALASVAMILAACLWIREAVPSHS